MGAEAKILGPITLGDNVTIGANTVMLRSVLSNSIWGGVPDRMTKVADSPDSGSQETEHGEWNEQTRNR